MTSTQTLLLDYGGTLDTDGRHWAHVLWEGFERSHVPVMQAQFREAYVYAERVLAREPIITPTDTFLDLLLKKTDIETRVLVENGVWEADETSRRQAAESIARYCYDYAARHVAASGRVLRQLAPTCRFVLVTNFYGNISAVLHDFGIADLFEAIVESAVVGVRKPDPAIWQLGARHAGVAPETAIAVGDSFSKDIEPAASLGCRTIWMKGEGWKSDEVADETLPDAIISGVAELPRAVAAVMQALR